MKIIYGFLAILGVVLPFFELLRWLYQFNMNFKMLALEVMQPVALSAWWFWLLATVVAILFILHDGIRLKMPKLWLPLFCSVCLGGACGLPLYLLLREYHIERSRMRGRPLFL